MAATKKARAASTSETAPPKGTAVPKPDTMATGAAKKGTAAKGRKAAATATPKRASRRGG